MRTYLFIGIFVSLFFLAFLLQNTSEVSVNFLAFKYTGPLAVTLLAAFLLGIIVSLLMAIPQVFKSRKQNKKADEPVKQA